MTFKSSGAVIKGLEASLGWFLHVCSQRRHQENDGGTKQAGEKALLKWGRYWGDCSAWGLKLDWRHPTDPDLTFLDRRAGYEIEGNPVSEPQRRRRGRLPGQRSETGQCGNQFAAPGGLLDSSTPAGRIWRFRLQREAPKLHGGAFPGAPA